MVTVIGSSLHTYSLPIIIMYVFQYCLMLLNNQFHVEGSQCIVNVIKVESYSIVSSPVMAVCMDFGHA